MKLHLVILALVFCAPALQAVEAVPLFNATLTIGKDHRFILVSTTGKASAWLRLGDTFEEYKLKSYNAKAGTLDLEHDGKNVQIALVTDATVLDSPAPTPATLADAEEVLRMMKFGEMMKKMAAQQSKTMEPMIKQMAGQMKVVDQEKFMAFQKKMMDEMMSVIAGPETEEAMARAYSEVFSKEELNGLSMFYGTPLGLALIEKQPEVSQKLNAFLMPRMMQMMPKMQQMAKDFAVEQKAAPAAASSVVKP